MAKKTLSYTQRDVWTAGGFTGSNFKAEIEDHLERKQGRLS